jgi:hypothetical protein
VLGKEHSDTLTSMNSLGLLLQSQFKYDKAEPMYRETLVLKEKVSGNEQSFRHHPLHQYRIN